MSSRSQALVKEIWLLDLGLVNSAHDSIYSLVAPKGLERDYKWQQYS